MEGISAIQLIRIPIVPWGMYFPGLKVITQPDAGIATRMARLQTASHANCQAVYQKLTKREQEILCAFARGRSPQEVAESLNIALSTVNSHRRKILAECRIAWELPESERLDYHFVRDEFALFVEEFVDRIG